MRGAALVAAAGCGFAAAYILAGTPAVMVLAAGLAVLGLLAAQARTPTPPPSRPARLRALDDDPDELREYPSYRRVREAVSWAPVSARHYDTVTRPLLVRLLAAALAERHGVDVHREPARARELVGEDVWPLVDPGSPGSGDSFAPGPDLADLRIVVNRLEELWPND